MGEWSGDTGPPGARDDVNAFFEGDNGEGCPPREPGGSLFVDIDNCNCAMLLTKLSGAFVPVLNVPLPRNPFVPRGPLLTEFELNAGEDELL